jgi:hypothetical protein
MRTRCLDDKCPAYADYGGRGIKVCERWMFSFENFLADVGPRPSPDLTIDRYPDQNGNYEPGNVRWATKKEQARNTRRNVWLEHNGKRMLATDWARELGISRQRMEQRIKKGLPPERLFAPGNARSIAATRGRVLRSPMLHFQGRTQSAAAWAAELGISPHTVNYRLRAGLPIERVLFVGRLPSECSGPRRKRSAPEHYRCSGCGQMGHNKQTCSSQQEAA